MARFLKNITFNVNGFMGLIHEPRDFVARSNPDVLVIQETHLREGGIHSINNYDGYSVTDLLLEEMLQRETAVYINSNIPHQLRDANKVEPVEFTAIKIYPENLHLSQLFMYTYRLKLNQHTSRMLA